MGEYISIHKASQILSVTPQTLRNWEKTGKLKPVEVGKSGYRWYTKESILEVKPDKKIVRYVAEEVKKFKGMQCIEGKTEDLLLLVSALSEGKVKRVYVDVEVKDKVLISGLCKEFNVTCVELKR